VDVIPRLGNALANVAGAHADEGKPAWIGFLADWGSSGKRAIEQTSAVATPRIATRFRHARLKRCAAAGVARLSGSRARSGNWRTRSHCLETDVRTVANEPITWDIWQARFRSRCVQFVVPVR
jgi:hypothetical protein